MCIRDRRSSDEVIAYLEKLRLIIQYLGASDCKLNEGSMRADVNLSVREYGAKEFGTRTEMKNLNSFKAVSYTHLCRHQDASICESYFLSFSVSILHIFLSISATKKIVYAYSIFLIN